MMPTNLHMQRILRETALAASAFSNTRRGDVDPDGGAWVVIRDVALPKGYNRTATDILFQLPPSYPRTPPDWFFADPGLRGPGGRPLHYFEHKAASRAPTLKGWAACSLHVKSWRPTDDPVQGHSLMSLCQLASDAFARWRR